MTGPAGLRVVVSPVGDGVCMPLREMKTKQPPYEHKEQANRASPVRNAPFWCSLLTLGIISKIPISVISHLRWLFPLYYENPSLL